MKNYTPALAEKDNRYYYAYDEKIPLIPVKDKYVITFSSTSGKEPDLNLLSAEREMLSLFWINTKTAIVELENYPSVEAFERQALKTESIYTIQQLYRLSGGLEMPISDEFTIGFSEKNRKDINALHEEFGITILESNEVFQLLRVRRGQDTLRIANSYQESGLVEFSHPNFLITPETFQPAPNDP